MHAIDCYRSRRVETASPAQAVLLLLREAARRVEMGAQAIEQDKPGETRLHLHAAREIVAELRAALDPANGAAAIVCELSALYSWAQGELASGSWKRDAERVRGVGRALVPLIEAWSTVAQGARP